jgi:hypothetical protein
MIPIERTQRQYLFFTVSKRIICSDDFIAYLPFCSSRPSSLLRIRIHFLTSSNLRSRVGLIAVRNELLFMILLNRP